MTSYNVGVNNPIYGKHRSEETKMKMRLAALGQKNRAWKGNDVGIKALHKWVKSYLPKPELCQICNKKPPRELANISPTYNPETYNRDFKNWKWLCSKCHLLSDGRLEKLHSLPNRSEIGKKAYITRRYNMGMKKY